MPDDDGVQNQTGETKTLVLRETSTLRGKKLVIHGVTSSSQAPFRMTTIEIPEYVGGGLEDAGRFLDAYLAKGPSTIQTITKQECKRKIIGKIRELGKITPADIVMEYDLDWDFVGVCFEELERDGIIESD